MTRTDARKFAKIATDYDIHQTLINARNKITDWKKPSRVNKTATIGTTFNVLSYGHTNTDYPTNIHFNAKMYILQEFGEYSKFVPSKKEKKEKIKLHHEEPRELKISK